MNPEFSLDGHIIALSASPANDFTRLGYADREFDHLVFELVMQILRSNGRVLYGGHLREESLTVRILEHLAGAYASGLGVAFKRSKMPILNLLAQSEFTNTAFAQLFSVIQEFRTFAEFHVVLEPRKALRIITDRDQGSLVLASPDQPSSTISLSSQTELDAFAEERCRAPTDKSLEMMRIYSSEISKGRIVAGGKRGDLGVIDRKDSYSGRMPGIYEEVIASLNASCPTIILGAYGGAARDVAVDLGLLSKEERTPFLGNEQEGRHMAKELLLEVPAARDMDASEELRQFARRDDLEALARDVVQWLEEVWRRRKPSSEEEEAV